MHRLEPVTDLRQRTAHDHAHGVVEVGLLDLVLQIHRLPPVGDRLLRDVIITFMRIARSPALGRRYVGEPSTL